MEFVGVTFNPPPAVRERRYPASVIVEDTLHVWAISRWRGPVELTREFLNLGYAHLNLPPGTCPMFRLNINPAHGGIPLVMLTVTFRNGRDAHALLWRVFWCGCEFIAFTTYNIFTNYESIFPAPNQMHSLPYNFDEK
ncbi:Auxin-induced protein 5NG4 [Hordeum vulgare]|nr:Auxin-induced protein 5NG4 [Hordeum vulgare]